MRTLVIDIETRPNLAYVWSLWDQRVGLNQIAETHSVISFAAKWDGERKMMFYSDHHDGHDVMVQAAWDLMNEADAIVHYNGRSFDVKHLNREFVLAELGPPSPHRDIDLLATAKGRFKFASNKLDHVADQLGLGRKVQHEGFELWVKCMAGDDKAWAKMRRYNIGDVKLTEKLYHRLMPWIKGHPNPALYSDDPSVDRCKCGSTDLQRRGRAYTPTRIYQQYQCNKCRSWLRGKNSIGSVEARGAA